MALDKIHKCTSQKITFYFYFIAMSTQTITTDQT